MVQYHIQHSLHPPRPLWSLLISPPHLQPNRKPIPDGTRHAAGNIGIMCIGFGSAIFHATLKWHAQFCWMNADDLRDEFWCCTWFVRTVIGGRGQNSWKLKIGLAAVPLTVSAVYLYYPNPILHQVCFGIIQLTSTYRTVLLFRTAPPSVHKPTYAQRNTTSSQAPYSSSSHSEYGTSTMSGAILGHWYALERGARRWDWGTGRSGDPGTCVVASFDWVRVRKDRSWDVLKYPGAFELTTPVWGLVPAIRWRVMGGKGGLGANAKMDKLQ
ncbi:Alkaline phytoceramidase [Rhizoctonia solani]|uniref:Alkaline phytoceramidase n=1 Tax=Rhizoctonia solani TaxID=456999 RepID=A0A8H7IAZ4_9AGAM|nr:Alkaline phytoceramidase [Rhizoctonia solani]